MSDSVKYIKYNGGVEASAFTKTNGTANDVLLADGTTIAISDLLSDYYTKDEADELHTSVIKIKGTIGGKEGSISALPTDAEIGDAYIVDSDAQSSYGGHSVESGDIFVWIKRGDRGYWTVIQSNWTASSGSSDLSWGSNTTLATVGGVNINAKLPTNPVDDLEIGGVNLLPNTRTGIGFTFQPQQNTGSSGEFDSTNKWFKFTCPQNAATTSQTDTILLKSPTVQLTPGTYTVSCQYRCTQPLNRMQVLCLPVTSEGSYDMNTQSFAFEVKSSSPVTYFKKYSATFNISEDLRDVYGWIIRIDLDHRGSHGGNQELYVKDIKLEKGHKATDWTPTLYEITPDLSGYLPLSGGTMTGAIDFEWNGSDIHNMLTWRKQGILQLDETDQSKLYLGTAAKLPLTVHELTTNGNILPSTSAPKIGWNVAIQPGEPHPTYISLGSTDAYFNKIYAREFKGLADNALKLYTYGTGFQQRTPYAINEGDASTPVYFKDGVPVECTGTLPTNQQITNWNLAYGWGDHSEVGYVTSSGVTAVYVGDGLYLKGLDKQHPTSLLSITSEGRITLKLGNDTQSDYYSNSDYEPIEERQYGVGLDAGGDLSVNVPWTDSKVTQSRSTSNGAYPLLCKYDTTNTSITNSVNFVSGITVNPSTGAVNAQAFYETSDIRKKEIKSDLSLDKCYDLIDKCQTVIYSLKDQTKEQVGMIAQEIEEFFPEVVATDEEGFKSLAYDRLVVICFKVLKDVIKRLEKLETK